MHSICDKPFFCPLPAFHSTMCVMFRAPGLLTTSPRGGNQAKLTGQHSHRHHPTPPTLQLSPHQQPPPLLQLPQLWPCLRAAAQLLQGRGAAQQKQQRQLLSKQQLSKQLLSKQQLSKQQLSKQLLRPLQPLLSKVLQLGHALKPHMVVLWLLLRHMVAKYPRLVMQPLRPLGQRLLGLELGSKGLLPLVSSLQATQPCQRRRRHRCQALLR